MIRITFLGSGLEVGRGEIVAGSFVGYDVVAYVGNVKLPELFGACRFLERGSSEVPYKINDQL